MGIIADKGSLTGLFAGLNKAKNGKQYLSVFSEGPKIDKVEIVNSVVVPQGISFGVPVVVQLINVEQKFKDFNGSFSTARDAQILKDVK